MDPSMIQLLAKALGDTISNNMIQSNDSLIKKLDEVQKAVAKAGAASAASRKRGGKKQNGVLTQILNKLSIKLPGGARAFSLGSIFTSLQKTKSLMLTFTAGLVGIVGVMGAVTEAFYQLGQQLGGVGTGRALTESFGILKNSLSSLFSGEFINPLRAGQIKGQFGKEFGGLVSTEDAKQLQLITQRLGLGVTELIRLERTLQSTGMDVEETVREFSRVGILSKVASEELSKNAGAVARGAHEFNRFIIDGISNAKKLGLEFGKIEKELSGFSSDFEGTVTQFAQLRAVIPGFSVDFNELFSTALYGTTEEYTEIIRRGLVGAGISTIAGQSRLVTQQLEMATGFSADQIDRILKGEEINFDMAADLDSERNDTLKYILGAVVAGFSAMLAKTGVNRLSRISDIRAAGKGGNLSRWSKVSAGAGAGLGGLGLLYGGGLASNAITSAGHPRLGAGLGILSGAAGGALSGFGLSGGNPIGAVLGGLIGAGAGIGASMNDFVFRPGQPPVPFSSEDTLVGVKDGSKLGGSVDTRNLEHKVDTLIMTMNEQLSLFKGGLYVEMRDLDKAIIRQQETTVRNF